LIIQLARENPRWGNPRIVGELKSLASWSRNRAWPTSCVAAGSVPRHADRVPVGLISCAFRRAQPRSSSKATSCPSTRSCSVATTCSSSSRSSDVSCIFSASPRTPTDPGPPKWRGNFCSDLGDAGRRVQFLVRNRDTKFSKSFAEVFASMGVATILTPVRAPKANAFAERWVRTVREDCLDRILVFSRRQLERVLAEYVEHYNRGRPHRSLEPTPPRDLSRSDHVGSIRRRDVLGGIIHEYERAA